MEKIFTVIGLMSGTSGDGIDASLIQSDGEKKLNILNNLFVPYNSKIRLEINQLRDKINVPADLINNAKEINSFEEILTRIHSEAVNLLLKKSNLRPNQVDLLGFHGHTIYHSHQNSLTKQIGNGLLLSKLTNINTIYNFRENDLKNQGQGAPLAPIYHNLLCNNLKIEKPSAFINIGGISNVTFVNINNKFMSFDTGPGNYLIDKFLQIKSNNKLLFDKDGEYAFRGSVNNIVLENYLNDPYYEIIPPKSLDINDFNISGIRGLNIEDAISTFSELTAQTIFNSFKFFKNKPNTIIICGGGRKNKYIFSRLEKLMRKKIKKIEDLGFDGDFIESQAFGYLAIRSFLKKPITFPLTTGVKKPLSGGLLAKIR